MFDVIPNHRGYLLEVDLVATSLYVLNLVQEPFNVVRLEVADEFPEENPQLLVSHTILTLIEESEKIENELVGVCFDIIGDLLNGERELSVLDLVPFLQTLIRECTYRT